MSLPDELKRLRERCFLTQECFAKEINVAFSTVNRWEGGRAIPDLKSMKNIKDFCTRNNIEYRFLEEAWLDSRMEDKK